MSHRPPLTRTNALTIVDAAVEAAGGLSSSWALQEFKKQAARIWGDKIKKIPLGLSSEPPKDRRAIAALSYIRMKGIPKASGDSLLRWPPTGYALKLSDYFYTLGKKKATALLIHEAVHIGYPRHDRDFMSVVKRYGGAPSESFVDDPTYKVQVKRGSRYQTVESLDTLEEARQWARQYMNENRGSKVRVIY